MARFGAPRGLQGELGLQLYSRAPAFFLDQPQWWCRPPPVQPSHSPQAWRQVAVQSCRQINRAWCVRLAGVDNREGAAAWRHGEAGLLRESFPVLPAGEYYWCDLLGLAVVNTREEKMGVVADVFSNGANDVLRVAAAESPSCKKTSAGELLIPFVGAYVVRVDTAAGVITVDWERDW